MDNSKVLISVDMEGIVGVESREAAWYQDKAGYEKARALMTDEVNTAVKACSEAGCKNVYVVDGHGNSKNIIKGKLNKNAKLLKSSENLKMMKGIDKNIDRVIFLGYHGMAGKKNSFCAHTNSPFIKFLKINGREFSEGMLNTLIAKHYNAKVIFISGTDKGVQEIKKVIPRIYSRITSKSLSETRAKSSPIRKSLEELKKNIKEAIKNRGKIGIIRNSTQNIKFSVGIRDPFPPKHNLKLKISKDRKNLSFVAKDIIEGHSIYRKILKIITQTKYLKMNFKIPFVKNPGLQCQQSCMIMALRYFYPERKFSFNQINKKMKRKKGEWTFPAQAAVVLNDFGLDAKAYSSNDISSTKESAVESFKKAFGEDYDEVIKNINVDNNVYFNKRAKKEKLFEIRKTSLNDFENWLGKGCLALPCVDSNVLYGREKGPFQGHGVMIVGMDKNNVWINDPDKGLNMRYPRKLFNKAYTVQAIDDDVLVIFGRKQKTANKLKILKGDASI